MGTTITVEELEEMYANPDVAFKRARWVTLEEASLLNTITQDFKPDYIFESGTANGFSTLWLSLYGAPVYTFDPVSRAKTWDNLQGGTPSNITYYQRPFEDLPQILSELKGSKSLFFVDGLHTSKGMQADCAAVLEHAEEGDTVIFHDLNIAACVRAFHRMLKYSLKDEVYATKRIMGRIILNGTS